MCGVAGFVRRQGASVPDLRAMSDQMKNRGPECGGFYIEQKVYRIVRYTRNYWAMCLVGLLLLLLMIINYSGDPATYKNYL